MCCLCLYVALGLKDLHSALGGHLEQEGSTLSHHPYHLLAIKVGAYRARASVRQIINYGKLLLFDFDFKSPA